MVGVRKGDEGCDGDAVTEGDWAWDDGGWDLWVRWCRIRWCTGGSIYDGRGRILEHCWHLGKIGLDVT